MPVVPQLLQIVLEYVSDHQRAMGGEPLPEPHLIGFARHILPIAHQQPAAAFDQAPCMAIGAQPIGLIDADAVDHLLAGMRNCVIPGVTGGF